MANATIIMLTNVAAILAVVVGGALYEAYRGPRPMVRRTAALAARRGTVDLRGTWFVVGETNADTSASAPGMKCSGIFSRPISKPSAKCSPARHPSLVVCVLKAMFYLLAYLVMLILADYTLVLGISEKKVSMYLFGTIGVSIAVGSVFAGIISEAVFNRA